ncbi:MAG: hypothetical protein LBV06_07620 [Propionibacteriaceae bacterium]|jgi:hypothetical protein|nr:hypothetical protein [Propionibacteriaceae bacterium]
MGWFGLPFLTPQQSARQTKAYQTKLLPYADQQRRAVVTILAQLTSDKLTDEERLFAFFHGKQALMEHDDDQSGTHDRVVEACLSTLEWLSPHDRHVIAALIFLDSHVSDMAHYPSVEQVEQAVESEVGRRPIQ